MGKANQVATTDRRVAQVVAIIGRDKARRDEIERAIHSLDEKQRRSWWLPGPHNKNDKLIGRSLARAIGKLEKQLSRYGDSEVLTQATYGWKLPDFIEFQAQLTRWRECFEAFAGEAKRRRDEFFPPTTWPLSKRPTAPKFRRKHDAVAAAAAILESHGLPLTVTRKSLTKKASVFCGVAAVLFGDPQAILYHQCRVFIKKARNRVSK